MPNSESRHPIQVVARRTGLSADVIRVWERRYRAVQPDRSRGSRRLYSDADVERLTLLRRATSVGRRIGDVAALDTAVLRDLVGEDEALENSPAITGASETATYLQVCLGAVEQLDPIALQRCLANAAVALSTPVLLEELIGPLMRDIGMQWRDGRLRVCHEHLVTPQVTGFLHAMMHKAAGDAVGPVAVTATPAGQRHEMGALMAALTAATEGWQVIYLGADLPAEDIAAAALQRQAAAVMLSITFPPDDPILGESLRRLRAALPLEVGILVGGASVDAYADVLTRIGIIRVGDFVALRAALERLRSGGAPVIKKVDMR